MLKRLAKLMDLAETERLDALRTPCEPGEGTLPSDAALKAFSLTSRPAVNGSGASGHWPIMDVDPLRCSRYSHRMTALPGC